MTVDYDHESTVYIVIVKHINHSLCCRFFLSSSLSLFLLSSEWDALFVKNLYIQYFIRIEILTFYDGRVQSLPMEKPFQG